MFYLYFYLLHSLCITFSFHAVIFTSPWFNATGILFGMFLGSILECFLLSVSKFQELTFLILFHVWASSFLIILFENQMIVVVWMYFWVLCLFYLIYYCCCSFCISAMLSLLLWIRSIIWNRYCDICSTDLLVYHCFGYANMWVYL